MALNTVSFSEISTWLACTKKWEYAYCERISPKVDAEPLTLGSAVHAAIASGLLYKSNADAGWCPFSYDDLRSILDQSLERWKQGQITSRNLFEEEAWNLAEIAETGWKIALRFFDWIQIDRWQTLWLDGKPMVEQELIAPLFGDEVYGFKFIPDWVAKDRITDTLWVFDHKTRSRMHEEDPAQLLQLPLYQNALSRLGVVDVAGTATIQILNRVPEIPQLTKKGEMSRANITSDWPTYRQAVIDAGLDPADYLGMKEKLDGAEFFRMTREYRAPAVARRIWEEVLEPVAISIFYRNDESIMHRSLGCNYCAYKPLCDAYLAGEDDDWIRETQFREKESR